MQRNQKGFGAVEGLLMIIIIGMLGFMGWYVYHAMQNTNKTYKAVTATNMSAAPKFGTKASKHATTSPTAGWTTIKSPDGSFSFKAPPSWLSLTCEKSGGSASTVYLAVTQKLLAVCQSDNTGEADLSMRADNSATSPPQKQSTDQSLSSVSFTLNGVKGYKTTEMTNADDVFLPNAKIITYSFYSGGKSFYASYRQQSNGQDDSATFEQIVQTWQF